VTEQVENSNIVPRKEREKLARQKEILNAARALFVANGYADITLDEIAKKAEFGKGTIYNYFNNKEELVAAIMDQMIDEMLDQVHIAIDESGTTDARSVLHAYATGMLQIARENWELTRLIMKELHQSKTHGNVNFMESRLVRIKSVWDLLAGPIRKDIEAGKLRPVDPVEVARIFDGMIKFYCGGRLFDGGFLHDQQGVDAVDLMISILFDGLNQPNTQGIRT
jgi:TetR/AcrR family transcriptional regulator, repressor of fatR-cypB operon